MIFRNSSDGFAAPADSGRPLDQLLVRVGHGDEFAFDDLYRQTSSRTFGLALRLVGNYQLAEEVTQEAWVQIWRHAARYEPGLGGAINWLLLLVRRRAIERIRAEEAHRARENRCLAGALLAPTDSSGFDDVLDRTDIPALHEALATLSQVQREAILSAYSDDHANRDLAVAALLNVPLGTAKYRIRQALSELRRQLSPAAA